MSRTRYAAALVAATGSMTRELALRRHAENALSARTMKGHPELVDRLVELHLSRPADSSAWSAQAAAGARYAGRLRQRRIRARTLILHGAADAVVDPGNGKLLADRIPDAQLVIFPELGHLLFWQDPDVFTDAVNSFLLASAETGSDPPTVGHIAPGGGAGRRER